MPVSRTRDKRRTKRANKRKARLAKVQHQLRTETLKVEATGKIHALGFVNGRLVYTSKPLRTHDNVSKLKRRWENSMAKRVSYLPLEPKGMPVLE